MDFITVMEWVGTAAFAVSGAAVAIEKELDYYGICFLAIITAIGGGIIRDVLIGRILPVSLADPMYAVVSLVVAVLCILFYHRLDKISHFVSVADGIGLAAFTAIGCRVAVETGHDGVYVTIALAVLTGTFGGVLRDVFVQEIPRCFRREIYAAASIAGALAFFAAHLQLSMGLAMYISFGVTLTVRLFAIFKKFNLGKVKLK